MPTWLVQSLETLPGTMVDGVIIRTPYDYTIRCENICLDKRSERGLGCAESFAIWRAI